MQKLKSCFQGAEVPDQVEDPKAAPVPVTDSKHDGAQHLLLHVHPAHRGSSSDDNSPSLLPSPESVTLEGSYGQTPPRDRTVSLLLGAPHSPSEPTLAEGP